jgi:lipoprotein Spr
MNRQNKINLLAAVLGGLITFSSCHTTSKTTTSTNATTKLNSTKVSTVANLVGIDEKEVAGKKLYSFISEWYGVPYKYGGCDKSGTDCSCFTDNLYSVVYQKKLPRSANDMVKDCDKISAGKVKEGDLVFFKINSNDVSHVGVVLKNNKFVHATTSKGVLISDINESYYQKYFYCYGKIK